MKFETARIPVFRWRFAAVAFVVAKAPFYLEESITSSLKLRDIQSHSRFSCLLFRKKQSQEERTWTHAWVLLVCTWRHGGHVGGQEQTQISPLGTKLQHGRPVTWLLRATRNWPGLEPHSREDPLSEMCKFQNVVFPRVLTRWSNLPPWRVEDPGVTDV